MDFTSDLDDYETKVRNVLNNGFKQLIDNINETLSQLLQSTILSAENLENGMTREFKTLVANITNTQVLQGLNDSIKTAEIKEEEADSFIDSFIEPDIISDTQSTNLSDMQYQAIVGSVSKEMYNNKQDIYNSNSSINNFGSLSQDLNTSHYFNNNTTIEKDIPFVPSIDKYSYEQKSYQPSNVKEQIKSKPDESSSSFVKPVSFADLKNDSSKNVESKPVKNPSVPPQNTYNPPKPSNVPGPKPKVIPVPPKSKGNVDPTMIYKQQEIRKRKLEQTKDNVMDETNPFYNPNNPLQCNQCSHVAISVAFLRRHVTTMVRKGFHVPPFKCEYCVEAFEHKQDLDYHVVKKHQEV